MHRSIKQITINMNILTNNTSNPNGTLIVNNAGQIIASQGMNMVAKEVNNIGKTAGNGVIKGDTINLITSGDITNNSGLIISDSDLNLTSTQGNILSQTLTKTQYLEKGGYLENKQAELGMGKDFFQTLGQEALIKSTNGDVDMNAKQNIALAGTEIDSNNGTTNLTSTQGSVLISTVTTSKQNTTGNAFASGTMGHTETVDIDYKTTNHKSQINASNLNINAGYDEAGNLSTNGTQNNIYIKGSDLHILGTTTFKAYGDVGIFSAQDYSKHIFLSEAVEKDLGAIIGGTFMAAAGALAGAALVMASGGAAIGPMTALAVGMSAGGGLMSGFEQENTTKITDIHENTTQIASNLNTQNLNIISSGDTTIKASNVDVTNDANISVGTITDSNNNETKINTASQFKILSDFDIAKNIFKKEEHKVELRSFLAMQFAIGLVSEFAGGTMGGIIADGLGGAIGNGIAKSLTPTLSSSLKVGNQAIQSSIGSIINIGIITSKDVVVFAVKLPVKSFSESLAVSTMEASGIKDVQIAGTTITEDKTEIKSNFNYNNLTIR